uniref:RNA-directed DNA polymerase n=1 Tax=Chilo suppressalis TaxID=168631 RepID=A0A076VEX3_CHISP|nr:polyprotein [Chilo suppressalis]
MFSTVLSSRVTGRKVYTDVLVYNGRGPSLLSRQASIELNLLRLGPLSAEDGKVYSVKPSISKETISKEYPNLFRGIGKLSNFKLTIPVDTYVKLIAQPVKRQPFNMRPIEEKLVKEVLDYESIEPVTLPTPCVSPSHIAKKKGHDQFRLVVDMRKANEAVFRERVPLPTFEELLADLNGCKLFSTLDLKSGYHQLEFDERSRNITVFSTSLGLFRYKRLFFGIRCALEILLQGIDGVANSQDDIRIGGRTQEEHDSRLKEVLKRLHDNGLTLNAQKCTFGASETTFLGHHISAAGIKPSRSSQQVIQKFRAPQNTTEVRSFLGLMNFSARFIPQSSTITAPLRELTKKDVTFTWNDEHEEVFQKLKQLIASAPALGFYDKHAETTLVTDASPVGISAVLIQKQTIKGEKQTVIIKYISKVLSSTEQRYSQTEKEALAIVWACETLYMHLIGKQFHILSDHKPLEIIYSANSKLSARIQRWVLRLQPFTFKVTYKPGRNNIADPVSRLLDISNTSIKSTEDYEDQLLMALIDQNLWAVTMEEIEQSTLKDKELCELRQALETDTWIKEFRKYELIKMELCVFNNIILRGTRIIIPIDLKERILGLGHEGHLSINSMKSKLRAKVWWKGIDKDIEYWVDTCEGCRLVRQDTYPEPIVPANLPSKVWELVALDYLRPLPSGHYLLIIVDYYSRYYEVEILRNQTAETTIKTLENVICREGLMDEIICDNGPAFRDERFKEFLASNGIRLRHTTPLWPQANGEVERQNKSVLRRLRIAQAMNLNWKRELQTYLLAYRTTPHSTTGISPGDVFKRRKIKTEIPEIRTEFRLCDEQIRDNDRYKKDLYKQYADKRRHAKELNLQPGDKVLVRQKKENKLTTPFSPSEHTVLWKAGNSVVVQSPEGKIVRRNSSHFKPIKNRDPGRFRKNHEEGDSIHRKKIVEEGEAEKSGTTDLTDEENHDLTNTMNRPQRERRLPPKYNDFLLGLIIDSLK